MPSPLVLSPYRSADIEEDLSLTLNKIDGLTVCQAVAGVSKCVSSCGKVWIGVSRCVKLFQGL